MVRVMADQNNRGQFGNREGTEEQARKGGQASSGSFSSETSTDPSQAGRKGAEAQPTEAKARGGENSHQGSDN
jgi:general stress protein YciG